MWTAGGLEPNWPDGGGRGQEVAAVNTYGGFFDGQPRPAVGRFPANLALECTCEAVEIISTEDPCKIDGDPDDPNHKNRVYGKGMGGVAWRGTRHAKSVRHTSPACPCFMLDGKAGDAGIPSRFFYCAKASRGEREAGLGRFPLGSKYFGDGRGNSHEVFASGGDEEWRAKNPCYPVSNPHPTVKPVDLNRWLATLLLPPASAGPRRLLVPFSGVGSEMIGALQAGWDEVIGIEQDADYCKIARARLAHWMNETPDEPDVVVADESQPSLFR